ncbi:FAD-dependent monooxygenase [Streptomyces brevispora]|uniref:Bifunctional hydroxylase/dehydrase n=1 Tax=Streptomyces brevispora TaxID=887462 RepID=A0A561TYF0_9ACTN|nr:FAD-dependent monooxygenase [Streptomyces brevispora]TWF92139.1 bifunctional hydroxylase/dehydrase [Streptomyces brevispora]WSC11556.1 FAD-dependent monooxygenase [Streptomyces brevispora]WSC17555.1 FAD-dependent monooxygenase [Streptomyces brevispora]
MQDFDTDVIIVGAGPTGLMLAGELRLAGIEALVLERLAQPMRQSRALGFSARTMEELGQRGLLESFGEMGVIPVGHFGGLPLDYTVLPGGHFGVRGVPQAFTEANLTTWATGLGAEIRRGWEVTGLTDDAEGVEVTADTPEGPRTLRARYLVGADGSRSIVRKLSGIDFPGTAATIEMLMADVTDVQVRLRPTGELGDAGMVVVLPVGPNTTRVVCFERDAGVRPTSEPPTFQEVADSFKRVTGDDISGGNAVWLSYFTDSSRQAAAYRKGRVFLAGDSAHIHMPIGAQGISAGLGDAVNLGWKLAATLKGHAPEGLLDTYDTERRTVAARIIANTLAQRSLYLGGPEMDPMRAVFAELLAYEDVRKHLVGLVTGFDITYDAGAGEHPLLGRRLPDFAFTRENGATTAYKTLHAGHPVLLDLTADPAVAEAAAPWADRVDVVTAQARPEGPLAEVDAVLVRPDGYTAWIGAGRAGTEGLADALSRWFGAASQN